MKNVVVVAVALAVGLFMWSVDQRTDDSGVEAALLVATALALTLAAPRVAIAIALAIGLPIAGWSLLHANAPGLVALVFAGAGAGIGYVMRRSVAASSG